MDKMFLAVGSLISDLVVKTQEFYLVHRLLLAVSPLMSNLVVKTQELYLVD